MKKVLIVFLLIVVFGLAGIFLILRSIEPPAPDLVALNDAIMSDFHGDDRDEIKGFITEQLQREYEIMNAAAERRDTILWIFLLLYTGTLVAAGIWLYIYCQRSVLAPFRKLQRFAKDIAVGNLDIPLEMDKHGQFGAFTESFDLMREELKTARENERAADRSKKELVASLSHDIKTPVASIKAATELMLISPKDDKEKALLERIEGKAEQINTLITNMFHATLEELQALSVTVAEVASTSIPPLIQAADHKGKVKPFSIPSCIVLTDLVRLQQIFDNIINNSYKYADTDIEVRVDFDEQYLVIDIEDHGPGAPEDELPLLFNKFYRGKNANEESGYGLGLYIAKGLLNDMSGDINCKNTPNGFAVSLKLRLAGS